MNLHKHQLYVYKQLKESFNIGQQHTTNQLTFSQQLLGLTLTVNP